ncbi:MAG: FtsQ-type POTRA domain-containing protein [Methylococcus sp.]|nr:FtsQ-type POTRA domain-containing protein [Methylococcus sp.]
MAYPGNQRRLAPGPRIRAGAKTVPAVGGNILAVFTMLVLVVLAAVWAFRSTQSLAEQRVQTIRVKGAFRNIDPAVVERLVRETLANDDTYFAVSLDGIRQAVATIPWVDDVQVERRWPDRVEVEVWEHRPVARWGDREFIDDHLSRFYVGSTQGFEHLPLLSGPDGQERRLIKALIGLNDQFENWGTGVAELKLTNRWSWSLRLESDIRIEFGRQEPLEAIPHLQSLLPLLGKERMALLQSIDLRYPYGFAVVWKPPFPDMGAPPEPPEVMPPA